MVVVCSMNSHIVHISLASIKKTLYKLKLCTCILSDLRTQDNIKKLSHKNKETYYF